MFETRVSPVRANDQSCAIDVSVIIPVYNMRDKVRRAVKTALEQQGASVEVICVDDGSTDNSLRVLLDLRDEDSRVKVLTQRNQGAGAARNTGLFEARGRYVAFLDPDDWFPTNSTIAKLISMCEMNDVEIAAGNVAFFDKHDDLVNRVDERLQFACEELLSFREFQTPFFFQRFLFSRNLLFANDVVFPHYRRFQDPIFLVKALSSTSRFATTQDVVYCYRYDTGHVRWDEVKLVDYYSALRELTSFAVAGTYHRLFRICLENMFRYDAITESMAIGGAAKEEMIETFSLALDSARSSPKLADCIALIEKEIKACQSKAACSGVYIAFRRMKWLVRELLRVWAWAHFSPLLNRVNRIKWSKAKMID